MVCSLAPITRERVDIRRQCSGKRSSLSIVFRNSFRPSSKKAPRPILEPVNQDISCERKQRAYYSTNKTNDRYPEACVGNNLLRDLSCERSCIHFWPMESAYRSNQS